VLDAGFDFIPHCGTNNGLALAGGLHRAATLMSGKLEWKAGMTATASMVFDPLTLAGIIGTALIVAAYFGNQQGRLKADNWKYPLANLIGAILIMLSLITAWNFPAAVMESFWVAISIYGLIKNARRR